MSKKKVLYVVATLILFVLCSCGYGGVNTTTVEKNSQVSTENTQEVQFTMNVTVDDELGGPQFDCAFDGTAGLSPAGANVSNVEGTVTGTCTATEQIHETKPERQVTTGEWAYFGAEIPLKKSP